MTYTRYCPNCNADLRDKPIPQEYIDKGYYSPEDPWYYRTIGIYDMRKDRIVTWKCPDCGFEWDRK